MAGLFRSYFRALERYPMRTMCGTTGTLMCAGDAIAQVGIERRGKNYDFVRSARFLGFGLVLAGPTLRMWYLGLDKVFKGTKMATLKMVLSDQLLFAPYFTGFFLTVMGALRGDPVAEVTRKLRRDYWAILVTNWKIWPACQTINFYFVPIQHRVLVVNFVAVFWNTYLAWKSEKSDTPHTPLGETDDSTQKPDTLSPTPGDTADSTHT